MDKPKYPTSTTPGAKPPISGVSNIKASAAKSAAPTAPAEEPRREFMAKASAVTIGAVLGLAPVASGIVVALDPLRRGGGKTPPIRLTTLDSLPDDGIPRQFPVLADRRDAWNLHRDEPIGAVYLVRNPGSQQVQAFNATCPHAGCIVDFDSEKKIFACPCHRSLFAPDGKRIDPARSPSPRDLDSLGCEVRAASDASDATKPAVKEVWVAFQNFQITKVEKIPKA